MTAERDPDSLLTSGEVAAIFRVSDILTVIDRQPKRAGEMTRNTLQGRNSELVFDIMEHRAPGPARTGPGAFAGPDRSRTDMPETTFRTPYAARRVPLDPEIAALLLPVPRTSPSFAERVFTYVDVSGDCWDWTGANYDGYGVIGRGSRRAGNMQAHRAVWELLVGPIQDGLQLDHLCRNHACCNPDHLEPVTSAVNVSRGFGPSVLHAKRDTCRYGHPKDGIERRKNGSTYRYCKTCARLKSGRRYVPKGPARKCKRGHKFIPENTYTDARGRRTCKACKAQRQRDARAAAAATASGGMAA